MSAESLKRLDDLARSYHQRRATGADQFICMGLRRTYRDRLSSSGMPERQGRYDIVRNYLNLQGVPVDDIAVNPELHVNGKTEVVSLFIGNDLIVPAYEGAPKFSTGIILLAVMPRSQAGYVPCMSLLLDSVPPYQSRPAFESRKYFIPFTKNQHGISDQDSTTINEAFADYERALKNDPYLIICSSVFRVKGANASVEYYNDPLLRRRQIQVSKFLDEKAPSQPSRNDNYALDSGDQPEMPRGSDPRVSNAHIIWQIYLTNKACR